MMRAPQPQKDVTGTVAIGDAGAVAAAVDGIVQRHLRPPDYDRDLLHAGFALVERMFAGEHDGYLPCDMPYHDMRHTLDTTLVMARMIDGYQTEHLGTPAFLTPQYCVLGVLLALFHDIGLIRRRSESGLCGPRLMPGHEARGIEFAETFLRATSLADHAALAILIDATRLDSDLNELFDGHEGPAIAIGHMLGTADLLSQIADRCYVERCFYHLYPEFVLGGQDRVHTPAGEDRLLYRDALDLLSKTPVFYERVVFTRLNDDFKQVHRYLAVHFDGADPYPRAVRRNFDRLARVVADDGFALLRREPPTTTRHLDPIYRSRLPGAPARR